MGPSPLHDAQESEGSRAGPPALPVGAGAGPWGRH